MTPIKMALEAINVINEENDDGFHLGMTLTMVKGKTPRGFPRPTEVLNEMNRNGRIERTCSYDPEKVLSWLVRNGLISVERKGRAFIITTVDDEDVTV